MYFHFNQSNDRSNDQPNDQTINQSITQPASSDVSGNSHVCTCEGVSLMTSIELPADQRAPSLNFGCNPIGSLKRHLLRGKLRYVCGRCGVAVAHLQSCLIASKFYAGQRCKSQRTERGPAILAFARRHNQTVLSQWSQAVQFKKRGPVLHKDIAGVGPSATVSWSFDRREGADHCNSIHEGYQTDYQRIDLGHSYKSTGDLRASQAAK